ncbi:MAG: glycosyltransferase family 4 protein [Actinomycetota bacterium]|nr:glycosyltransferase family 4 protein [Actinomycetota bacterium]
MSRQLTSRGGARKLLSLDSTYSLATIRERKLEHEITCRDLEGFFEHVWSVHPMVGASPEHVPGSGVGRPSIEQIAPRHTMIEGKVARFEWLEAVAPVNFLVAQSVLAGMLMRLIRRERISIVRAGDPYYLGLLGLFLARANKLPLVVRINANQDSIYEATRELAYPRLLRSRLTEKRVARFVLSRADLVAPGSENNLRFAVANGAWRERSTIFRYGTWIDPVHFRTDPRERTSVRSELDLNDAPFLIIVGRLERVKHPEDVLYVLAEARKHAPSLAAVFVGDGSMRPELESMAAELGVAGQVRFAGNRDQNWIARALASATVVLSPLTGRALVEACLSATPVIAYDVEWHSELVTNGESGILVPYRDTRAMAEAVNRLLSDAVAAQTMGERARAVAAEMMDPARLMEHERSEYIRLLDRWR